MVAEIPTGQGHTQQKCEVTGKIENTSLNDAKRDCLLQTFHPDHGLSKCVY